MGSLEEVSIELLVAASLRGDLAQLRRWEQRGVRRQRVDLLIASAACGTSLDVLRYFVNELATDVNGGDEHNFTPVHAAAQLGHLESLRCLVEEFGADVNQATDQGCTPVFVAALEGKLLAVLCLGNEFGADVNRPENKGCTPLYAASQRGHLSLVRCLVKDFGANVNQANNEGSTPLFIAARFGHLSVVQCLVKELGADIHQGDNRGGTPLMAAANRKHADVVKWLVKAGANPNTSIDHWGTAADLSKEAGASAEQTAYLEAKMHCSSPGCSGAGIMKCTECKQARYCGEPCQLAHWKTHKADCKRWSAERFTINS
jgi:ankyrin repeat protein